MPKVIQPQTASLETAIASHQQQPGYLFDTHC
jgi:hypothetical protein